MRSNTSPALIAIQSAACLGFLVVQLDVSVVNVALGDLKAAFDTNLTGLQWVINSYALVFSALLILGGALGDKFDLKQFHDILKEGAMPLTILERRVDERIAAMKPRG